MSEQSTQPEGSERGERSAAAPRLVDPGHVTLGEVAVFEAWEPDAGADAARPSHRGAALVRDAIARHRPGRGEREPVLVLSGQRSGLAAGLTALGQQVSAFRSLAPGAAAEGAAIAGGQGVLVLDELLGQPEGARAVLSAAYQVLRPGGLLVLTVGDAPAVAGRSTSPRDRMLPLLFAEGFERCRFQQVPGGQLVVHAYRSQKLPPYRRNQLLSVVMPVYNERATFREVMDKLLATSIEGLDLEVVVVESNSNDGTREEVLAFADDPRVRIVLEERASGKGHAVRAGIAEATGDFLLIQDADLEYDLDDYARLLEPLRSFSASFVLGERTRTHGARWGVRHFEKQIVVSRLMNVGNAIFLTLFNLVYRSKLADPFTMYKVVLRDCLHGMRLECDRFDFDWELMAKLLRAGYRPVELPVSYHSRSFSEGKKVSVLGDPLSWVVACFKYRFAPFED